VADTPVPGTPVPGICRARADELVDPPMNWLIREGTVLAAAEVMDGFGGRARGLLGRTGYEGAMVLPGTRSVHTFGMRFPVDVAFCDRALLVLDTARVVPLRMTLPRRGCRTVIEAEAGAFERWGLRAGDKLELRG